MSQKPFETWTRTEDEERTLYYKVKARRRLRRGTLALLGVALILLSVGWVFADVQSVGNVGVTPPTPKSERLRLTIPKIKRVRNIPVYNGTSDDEGKLAAGVLHMEDTGFPWQQGSNVYIAGHRLGYPRTKSWLVFWNLDKLKPGNKVILKDAMGRRYEYEVFNKMVVEPNHTSVKDPIKGKSIVTLQTCTLPNYKQRLIVQAELVPNQHATA